MKIINLESDVENCKEKEKKNNNELKQTLSQYEIINKDKTKLQKQCDLLKSQLSESNKIQQISHEEKIKLEIKLREKESELDNKANERIEIRKENQFTCEEMGKKNKELENEIERRIREKKLAEEEKNEIMSKLRFLEEDAKGLKIELKMVTKDSEQKLKLFTEENEKVKKENIMIKAQLENLMSDQKELENANDELIKACESYKDKFINAKQVNKNLKKKLNSLEDDIQIFVRQRELEISENHREPYKKTKESTRSDIMKDVKEKINQFKTDRILK